ncbi:MAG TPA: hypothetical protein VGM96_10125 [Reyranella sp.]|jgi:hypothetical protein
MLGRALRILCALAVAITTTFHVCGATDGRAVDVVAVAADTDDSCPPPLKAVEKCHICALAFLPAILAPEHNVQVAHVIPDGTTLKVTSFSQPAIGPPPRA